MSLLPVEQGGKGFPPSRRELGRALLSRPSVAQSNLSFAAALGRERCKAPVPSCRVLTFPAEYSASPTPAGSSPPPPSSPNAPSPADRPCANKRPPCPPARLWRSAGQAMQVGLRRSPGSGLQVLRQSDHGALGVGSVIMCCRPRPAPVRA